MITYIKYPLSEYGLSHFIKYGKFIKVDKIEKCDGFIIAYPESKVVVVDGNEKVIYPSENKIGFYCKSLQWKDILKFKGGFNIEKCSMEQWQIIGKKWYKENGIKLPRKLKKKIIGTIK